MAGNASRESTLDFAEIAREILADARAIDDAEDEEFGEARGDELPEQLRTREGRAEFFGRVRGERTAGQEQGASKLGDGGLPTSQLLIRRRGMSSIPSGSWRACRGGRVGRARRAASWSSVAGGIPILF